MNNSKESFFKLRKNMYQHCFGLSSRLGIPYDFLKRRYYRFIMKKLSFICESAYNEVDFNHTNHTNRLSSHYVWVMWWQGTEEAPKLVKENIKYLKKIWGNDLKIITKNNLMNYIEINSSLKDKFKCGVISQQVWSDIIRVNLLEKYGGLWIDSTVILSKRIYALSELFDRPFFSICSKRNSNINVSNENWATWFIGGNANEPIFVYLKNFYVKYFSHFNFILDYFLTDYAIRYFYESNESFRKEIETQKRDWHTLYFYNNLYNPVNKVDLLLFDSELGYCIQKVTYKIDEKRLRTDSFFNYILDNILKGN